ncbi:hypothetical protein QAD02_004631 [Eretmocerus hayati]|uniref:Uncharacterized protein n=1 Tax=Eretmocerus hayati TaxID=131215 RepID=A0ACC2NSU1_9HYME|nr:hypothetical protein QAD02_004631 [Eretmocerus hayati]
MILDDEEKLKAALLNPTKRLPLPSLERCQTKNSLKPDKSNKENEKVTAKKPKMIKNRVLSENQLIDISKIKKEIVEKKKQEVNPKSTSKVAATISEPVKMCNKKSFDLLHDNPCKQIVSGSNYGKAKLAAISSTSSKQGQIMSTPVKLNGKPSSTKLTLTQTPTKKTMITSTPAKSNVNSSLIRVPTIETPIKRASATLTSTKGNSKSSPSSTSFSSSFGNDESFKESDQLILELKAKLREKEKINTRQAKEIEELRKSLKNKDDILLDLTKASLDLQKNVIDNHKQLFDIVRNLKQSHVNTAEPDGSHMAIGTVDQLNLMVHVGQTIWMAQVEYTYAFSLVDPKEFVRHMALHLFGLSVLKKSTVTGKSSNRSKNENNEESEEDENCKSDENAEKENGDANKDEKKKKKKWAKLDPVIVNAITDSLAFFLKLKKFDHISNDEKMMHVLSVKTYLSAYIADLKKPEKLNLPSKGKLNKKRKRNNKNVMAKSEKNKKKRSDDSKSDSESDDGLNEDKNDVQENEMAEETTDERETIANIVDKEIERNELADSQEKLEFVSDEFFMEDGEVKKMILGREEKDSDEEDSELEDISDLQERENAANEKDVGPQGNEAYGDTENIDDTQTAYESDDGTPVPRYRYMHFLLSRNPIHIDKHPNLFLFNTAKY